MSAAILPTQSAEMTAEEFLSRHGDERGIELVRGIVRRKPMPGARHGFVCVRMTVELGLYLKTNDRGYLISNDTLVRTEHYPPTFRGPDVQFISYERIAKGSLPVGVPNVSPELVIEVRSPSNTWRELTKKALEYLDADVKVVVLIDPDDQSATIFRPDTKPQSIGIESTLTVPELLPGFAVPLRTIFE